MPLTDTLSEPRPQRRAAGLAADGFGPGQFSFVFALLIFAAFPQVLLGLQSFAVRDFGFFSYPVAHFQRESFWRGEVPLWNPWNDCGVPFLAQWNTMALYPPTLIYLVLPLTWSLSFFCLAHLFWSGLGMFFLARRWTGSGLGGCVAGLVFGFNGFALNLLMWPSHIATYSWMPWVVLAVERACREGGRAMIAAALVGALQMLAGGPETIFFTWMICLGLWLAALARTLLGPSGTATPVRVVVRLPVLVLLVTAICAAQLFPFLDLAAHSQREAGYADARWSMPSWGWANLLAPMVFGFTGKQGLFFQHGQYWTSSYYLGLPALVLAALGIGRKQPLRTWFLFGLALAGLVLATGDQTSVSNWLRHVVPQLTLMTYPVKFVALTVFSIPLMAAYGTSWLQANVSDPRAARRVLALTAAFLLLLGAVLFWAWRWPLAYDNTPAALRNGAARALVLVIGGTLLWLYARRGGLFGPGAASSAPRLLPLCLLLMLWLDVWTHEPQQNPGVPGWVYAPNLARQKLALNPAPALGVSRAMVSPVADEKFRNLVLDDTKDNFLVKRLGFFADCNLLDAIPKVDGFFSLYPREIGELNSALYVSRIRFGQGLLDFLSVSHVSDSEDYTKWNARPTALPLFSSGQQPVFLDDTNALGLIFSPGFNPRKTVALPQDERGELVVEKGGTAEGKLEQFSGRNIRYAVSASAPCLAVIGQTYYHWWRAYVDQVPTKLLRANYAFQALQIPAGKHEVELRYEDGAFHAGVLVSVLSLCGCGAAWWWLVLRSGRRPRHG